MKYARQSQPFQRLQKEFKICLIFKNCKLKYFCAMLQNKTLSRSLYTDNMEFHAQVQKTAITLCTHNSAFTLSVIHRPYNTGLSSRLNFWTKGAPSTGKGRKRVFSLILSLHPLCSIARASWDSREQPHRIFFAKCPKPV